MNRTPPLDVQRALRREVGFGCPVPGCGSPFLSWHHFDPPWRVREHHTVEGMIALCRQHHDAADAGAFTVDQLRQLKREAPAQANAVSARFDWMRRDLLAIVGGCFYCDVRVIFQHNYQPVIWFTRDDERHLLLNVRMGTTTGEPRLQIEEHGWSLVGPATDVTCPPSGKLLDVRYGNGDMLRVEFFEIESEAKLRERHPHAYLEHWGLPPKLTAVEIHYAMGGTACRFGPNETTLPNFGATGALFRDKQIGIHFWDASVAEYERWRAEFARRS